MRRKSAWSTPVGTMDRSLHGFPMPDPKKIARYTLDRWAKLKQYGNMDKTRNRSKTMDCQSGFYMAQKTAMKNNLIALLDQSYPGANDFFDSPARSDGSQKWVDLVHTYWHVDCVRGKSLNAFIEHYRNWCKRKGYDLSPEKAGKIYQISSDLIAVFPKDDNTKMLTKPFTCSTLPLGRWDPSV